MSTCDFKQEPQPQFAVGDEVEWGPTHLAHLGPPNNGVIRHIDKGCAWVWMGEPVGGHETVALAHLRPAPPATEEIEVVLNEYIDHVRGRKPQWTTRDINAGTGRTAVVKFTVSKRGK